MSTQEWIVAGRYRLQEPLGRGGMAHVHVAHDQVLDRTVAVKLLRSTYVEDETFLERFRREARAAARLNHRNIVAVHDTGDDDGTPFIVMELVPGPSLDRLLEERGALPAGSALTLMVQVCDALAYAHDHGVVHRDVKPGNILVVEDDGDPTVKVTDFGIARAAGDDTITLTSVVGTAAYLAPEQARGERVDARADIYSAGIVLYELLTGVPPYEGETAIQVALRHVGGRPTPPSELAERIPEDLETVVLTALAKDPADRYQTAAELRRDLEAVQEDRPVSMQHGVAAAAAAGVVGETQPMPPTADVPGADTAPTRDGAGEPEPDGGADAGPDTAPRRLAFGLLVLLAMFAILALLAGGGDGEPDVQVTPTEPVVGTTPSPTAPTPDPVEDGGDDLDGGEGDGGEGDGGDGAPEDPPGRGPPDDRGRDGDGGRGNGGS